MVFTMIKPVDSFLSVEEVVFSSFSVDFVSSLFLDFSVVSEKKEKDELL